MFSINPISVAPMLDYTDRHFRALLRIISKKTLLYTEMVTVQALLQGNISQHFTHVPQEAPVALQLGGSDPKALAECAKIGQTYGFTEINLNVGCPSSRVQSGRFGACLMAEPALVADCVGQMQAAVQIPVTVKTRIGIDAHDSYEQLAHFIQTVATGGVSTFIIHARKAWLQGLSPKENRTVPPLRYDVVQQLKQDFPHLAFVLNGGIPDVAAAVEHLQTVDGVMLGRAICQHPYLLATVDRDIFKETTPVLTRAEVVHAYSDYVEQGLSEGVPLAAMTRHLLGLYYGMPGARRWRRFLTENSCQPGAGVAMLNVGLREMLVHTLEAQ